MSEAETKAPEGAEISETGKIKRSVVGRVISNKMDKTVTIAIERYIKHPTYGKYVRRTGKVLAHDEANECREGDRVAISECKPLSKRKAWQVVNVIERAAEQ